MVQQVLEATGTIFTTYSNMNPQLCMHTIYAKTYNGVFVPEHCRVAFSRIRISSHTLCIGGLEYPENTAYVSMVMVFKMNSTF